ncbi:MAG: hypothetical protein HC807_03155 [Gammaproteobacteria bacterium]|nr:hypothetical protein [Gammaproteobacteria bacterium]
MTASGKTIRIASRTWIACSSGVWGCVVEVVEEVPVIVVETAADLAEATTGLALSMRRAASGLLVDVRWPRWAHWV